eukprot:c34498_g1_i1.p1 GENE.c34498_g1_i1~~c34498_g1_i1.p1  ORF type:complete len:216 (+),score=33.96 c34498_g1_i1:135-782(+)
MRTKVVLRRLPPSLTEEQLRTRLQTVLPKTNYFSFTQGSLGPNASLFSRACLNFLSAADAVEFGASFKGVTFLDEAGVVYPMSIEYAPFQRVPRSVPFQATVGNGSLDTDTLFLAFQDELRMRAQTLPSAEAVVEAREKEARARGDAPMIVTPLIAYIRAKQERKLQLQRKNERTRKRGGKAEGPARSGGAAGAPAAAAAVALPPSNSPFTFVAS